MASSVLTLSADDDIGKEAGIDVIVIVFAPAISVKETVQLAIVIHGDDGAWGVGFDNKRLVVSPRHLLGFAIDAAVGAISDLEAHRHIDDEHSCSLLDFFALLLGWGFGTDEE
jgi:hypothetical protein